MSIQSSNRVAGPYLGNNSTTLFPFAFKVFSPEEVRVVLTDADADSDLRFGTDYTVALNNDQDANPGGTITVAAAPTGDKKLTITSKLANLQPETLTNQGGFYPKVIEYALDRLTILVQQVGEQVDRCLKLPVSDPAGVPLTLPPVAQRAGKSVKFDNAGALVPTQFDPDALQSSAASSASAAAASADQAAQNVALAETHATAAGTARTGADASRDQAALSAAAALAAAQSIGEEKVEVVTANRAATLADNGHVWAVDASAGAVTVTLPLMETVGEPYRLRVKKTDATDNKVMVQAQAPDTLDGSTSALELSSQHDGVQLSSDLDPDPNNWVSQRFGVAVGDATPVGTEAMWPGTTPPPAWRLENGDLLSRITYASLWAHAQASGMLVTDAEWNTGTANRAKFSSGDGSTNFRIPDLITGNLFIRARSGADPLFGSRQEDTLQEHGHSARISPGGSSRRLVYDMNGTGLIYPNSPDTIIEGVSPGRVSGETAPRSAGRLPIIKVSSVPIDPKTVDILALATQVSDLSVQTSELLAEVNDLTTQLTAARRGDYVSGQNTYTNGALLTLSHGLGTTPSRIEVQAYCAIPEAGYAATASALSLSCSSSGHYGASWYADSTNIYILVGAAGLYGLTASTRNNFSMTPANWRLVARAWE